ncbi:MAG: hypothetical protein KGJ70_06305, partial [Gemmatimonadota bacterium]|nr:hypothetical protein [Gemmatimonadota bacterium]
MPHRSARTQRAIVAAALLVGPAGTGTVEGTVLLSPSLAQRRPRFRIYADPGPGQQPPDPAVLDTASEMANVVVYLVPESGTPAPDAGAPPAEHPTVSQSGERFVPHVLAVVRGTTVDFPNRDDVYHNVFSLSAPAVFDLGRYPKGESRAVTFDRP